MTVDLIVIMLFTFIKFKKEDKPLWARRLKPIMQKRKF